MWDLERHGSWKGERFKNKLYRVRPVLEKEQRDHQTPDRGNESQVKKELE